MYFHRPKPFPLLAVTAGVLILIALGCWQLQRLSWKEGLLSQIAAAAAQPALGTLPDDPAALQALEYRRVMLAGRWLSKPALHFVGRATGGYVWLAPLQLEDSDQVVLVSAGWYPSGAKVTLPNPPVSGFLRPPHIKRLFSPGNHAEKNIWFVEDIPEMEKTLGLKLLPMIVETQPPPPLRNDHLGYAITWFLLAIALAGMFGWAQRKSA